ncbi:MAG: hypothetical protein ACPGVB_14550, partial [Chitinophagales bacterium]
MNILRTFILFLVSTFSLSAQFYFNKNYDFEEQEDIFWAIENHTGNQTVAIGITRSINLENKITFSFLDGLGNQSRSIVYGEPLIQYRNVQGILDENALVVSATFVENGQEDFVHAFLMKMSLFGEVLWTQKTGLEDRRNVTKRHIATSDEGYLLVGYTDDFSSGNLERIAYAVKVDSLGTLLWEKTYGTADSLESIFDVVETDDNHYLFLGQQSDGDNSAEHGQNQDIWLMKADQNGEVVWEKKHGDIFFQEGNDIQRVEGGYVIVGTTHEENVVFSRPFGWVLKVDENGEYLWERKYAGISYTGKHWRDNFREVRETKNGDLIIVGLSDNFNTTVTNMGILVKMTADGDSLWTKAYHNSFYQHVFFDFELAEDGGFNICGWTDYGVESGTRDGWILKVDSLGNTCQPANCDSIFTTSIHYDITTHYPTHFYPNPAQNRVTFQHRLPKGKEAV